MTVSYNGWPAVTTYEGQGTIGVKAFPLPGTTETVRLNADAAPVLLYIAERWNAEVEPIGRGPVDDWGFAPRPIRGSTTVLSNHASGTALDINATKYPRGTSNMGAAKQAKVRKILADVNALSHVVDWGGDYKRSPLDQMHVEIAPGVSKAELLRVMARLDSKPVPRRHPPTLRPKGKAHPYWTRKLQERLLVKVDGVYGSHTAGAVKAYRRKHRIWPATGTCGYRVWKALGLW